MELKLILFDYNSEQYFPVRKVKMGNKVFANLFNRIYYYKNYKIVFKGRKTTVKKIKNIKLSAFKSNLYGFLRIVKHGKYCAFTRFFSKLDKKYILINDRLDKAGDNGEALFKYINKYEPKLAKNTFYVISSDCKDYNRLKKYGKVVKTGSLKHRILFLNAAFIYSSHTMFEFYSAFDRKVLGYYRDLLKYKFVWLQHGITQNDISRAANRYIKGIDYITTCTNAEHKEFLQDKYCFEESQVILTGFARYDFLENDPKNIIAIAPTWRRGYGLSDGKKDDFIDTAYYKNYSNLLTNKKLLDALTDNNLIIKFFLHPEMANYFDDFKKLESSNVKVIDTKDINYSKIFSESSLFITDYSSTFFDFAYLEKPEIFFQFDIDEFYKTHYKKGYFNHKKDAFGDVIENPKALVDKILFYIDNGFVMEKKYQNLVHKTFAYHDTNNSKRIIEQTYIKEME